MVDTYIPEDYPLRPISARCGRILMAHTEISEPSNRRANSDFLFESLFDSLLSLLPVHRRTVCASVAVHRVHTMNFIESN